MRAYNDLQEHRPPENAWESIAPNAADQELEQNNAGSSAVLRHVAKEDRQAEFTVPPERGITASKDNTMLRYTKERNKSLYNDHLRVQQLYEETESQAK